jgi:hypothetical protein
VFFSGKNAVGSLCINLVAPQHSSSKLSSAFGLHKFSWFVLSPVGKNEQKIKKNKFFLYFAHLALSLLPKKNNLNIKKR